jgi:hypothetical protein
MWVGLVALGAALAVTACGDNSTKGTATASPSATTRGAAGPVPACVAGTWRSTSATATTDAIGNGMTGTISGGQGLTLTIGADGAAKADFTPMQPLTLAVTGPSGNVKGQYSYSGTVTGTMRFSGGSA